MVDSGVGRYLDQLLRGVVEPLMLFIIGELPSHGYRIAREIERRSAGYLNLTASTVYSALRRLEDDGLVCSTWETVARSPRRRCYQLTEDGRKRLRLKLDEWQRFSLAAAQVLGDA